MKARIIAIVAVVVLAAAAYAYFNGRSENGIAYRFVSVSKGNLESVVSATGTLSAVTTVQVGTQVSGIIDKLNVDFNDHVEKGEVIAQLDTTVLESAVRDAEATIDRNQAQLLQAQRDFERITTLHQQGISPDADLNTAQYNLDVAKAMVKSAQAALDRARQNLSYATITAPVSGTVIERDVDVGQTVAASLSAPKLFLIANDLSHMQILAQVDESDIGQIKDGQTARFTVKTYPDRKFTGTVRQVRMQSTIDQNVVNYTVVVDVANPDGALLPGMTATVEFLVASAQDVLKVPNAALRFRPTEAMMQEFRERRQKERAAAQDGAAAPGGAAAGEHRWPRNGGERGAGGARNGNGMPSDMALLWFLDADGKLDAAPARIGITDGQYTAITSRRITDGMELIAGMTQTAETGTSNPFQPASGGERHGPRF